VRGHGERAVVLKRYLKRWKRDIIIRIKKFLFLSKTPRNRSRSDR
jgi:hypothetical protein